MPGYSACFIILDTSQSFRYGSSTKYTSVLNMQCYSLNNIFIIVSNAITLEFLYAQFVHPGAP